MTIPKKAEVQLYAPSDPQNVAAVKEADLLQPQVGNWSINIAEMAGDDAVLSDSTGAVTVQWSGSTLQGHVERAAPDRGIWQGLIVGGKGGLNKAVTAQHYYQTPAMNIVKATLALVGETLATDSTGLSTVINYPRRAVSASRCLDELCDVLGLIWRVKLDGTIWLGTYTWPTAKATFVYQRSSNENDAKLMPDVGQPLLEPGTTIVLDSSAAATAEEKSAQKIGIAMYMISDSLSKAQVWFVDPLADSQIDDQLAPDRMHAGVAALSLQALRGVDWYRSFQGQVVTQRNDGTLDVILDAVKGIGELPAIRGVTVSVPVGGAVRTVRANERCTVIFEAGDFRRPRAVGFESATSGGNAVGRVGDSVDMGQWQTVANMTGAITSIIWTPPGGGIPQTLPIAPVIPVQLNGKISSGSPDLKLP